MCTMPFADLSWLVEMNENETWKTLWREMGMSGIGEEENEIERERRRKPALSGEITDVIAQMLLFCSRGRKRLDKDTSGWLRVSLWL